MAFGNAHLRDPHELESLGWSDGAMSGSIGLSLVSDQQRMKSGFAVKFRSPVASQEVKLLTAALRQGVRVVKKIGMSEASRGAM